MRTTECRALDTLSSATTLTLPADLSFTGWRAVSPSNGCRIEARTLREQTSSAGKRPAGPYAHVRGPARLGPRASASGLGATMSKGRRL